MTGRGENGGELTGKRSRRVLYYGLSLLLVIGYISVAGLAANPEVSLEYDQYYIEGNVESWPGEDGLAYEPGERLYFGQDAETDAVNLDQRGKGWAEQEPWGTWSRGPEVHLVFTFEEQVSSGLNLSINATGFAAADTQVVDVVANDHELASIRVDTAGINTYDVTIPARYLETHRSGDTLLHVAFLIRNPVSPKELGKNDDTRELGLGVQWVELQRTNRTAVERRNG